jgi:hypothetical protein
MSQGSKPESQPLQRLADSAAWNVVDVIGKCAEMKSPGEWSSGTAEATGSDRRSGGTAQLKRLVQNKLADMIFTTKNK